MWRQDDLPTKKLKQGVAFLFMMIILHAFITSFMYAANNYQEIQGEIIGINPSTVEFSTNETIVSGQQLHLLRGNQLIAVLKVVKVKGNVILAEITETHGEIDFEDKIMKLNEVKSMPQEQQKEKQPKVKTEAEKFPTEKIISQLIATTSTATKIEKGKPEEKNKGATLKSEQETLKENFKDTKKPSTSPVGKSNKTSESSSTLPEKKVKTSVNEICDKGFEWKCEKECTESAPVYTNFPEGPGGYTRFECVKKEQVCGCRKKRSKRRHNWTVVKIILGAVAYFVLSNNKTH